MTPNKICERLAKTAGAEDNGGLHRFQEALRGKRRREGATLRIKGQDIRLSDAEIAKLRAAIASLVPSGTLLSSGEAAEVLNVSPAYMDRLLRDGQIPCSSVPGSRHRRVALNEVMAYKQRRDSERAEAMAALVALGEEADLYEREEQETREQEAAGARETATR